MGVFTFNYSPQGLDLFAIVVLKNPHRASALLLRNHAPFRRRAQSRYRSDKVEILQLRYASFAIRLRLYADLRYRMTIDEVVPSSQEKAALGSPKNRLDFLGCVAYRATLGFPAKLQILWGAVAYRTNRERGFGAKKGRISASSF